MSLADPAGRRAIAAMEREALEAHQLARLNELLAAILPANQFYAERLGDRPRRVDSLADFARFPYTFKEDLLAAQGEGAEASNRTFPAERYIHFHQTSGTRGRPLVVLDTAEDWRWWIDCWQFVLDSAGLAPGDGVFLAFSFGPYIGFWSAYHAALARGCLAIPGGGLNTTARLELIDRHRPAAICCTPSYALHLAEAAEERNFPLARSGVRAVIVAGEPGGSVPAVRERIESRWGAAVIDHAGATEVGPWGWRPPGAEGLYVLESEFIAEFRSTTTGRPAGDGELAELVLTSLGRRGSPVIRYRTGDVVRVRRDHADAIRFARLDGGVLGRADDMIIVRGMNIFPSAIDHVVRSFPEVLEYRVLLLKDGAMDQLLVEIEDRLEHPDRVAEELRLRLGLKVDVRLAPLGSLPRFEGKARRIVDRRGS
jgi:phenylacetate-CoA ligase